MPDTMTIPPSEANNRTLREYYARAGWLLMRCAETELILKGAVGLSEGSEAAEAFERLSDDAPEAKSRRLIEAWKSHAELAEHHRELSRLLDAYLASTAIRNRIAHGVPRFRDGQIQIVYWTRATKKSKGEVQWHPLDFAEIEGAIYRLEDIQSQLECFFASVEFKDRDR